MAGAATIAGASGVAGAQERPDFGGWLDGVDGGFEDARGQSEVTVMVGAEGNNGPYAFSPAGLWVDSGTTVRWEWTGEGGAHNVHAQEGADFESDLYTEAGVNFEHTFGEGGIVTYQCDPHASLGMKGAVAVGGDVPTTGGGGNGGGNGGENGDGATGGGGLAVPASAKTIGVAASAAMVVTLSIAYLLLKYGGGGEPGARE